MDALDSTRSLEAACGECAAKAPLIATFRTGLGNEDTPEPLVRSR